MQSMSVIKRKYWGFYIEGRDERHRAPGAESIEPVAEKLLGQDDGDIRTATEEMCQKYLDSRLTAGSKRNWIKEREEAIREEGCDAETAYAAWRQGRLDQLVAIAEPHVLSALSDMVLEDDEG
jgi:hypothetical protein